MFDKLKQFFGQDDQQFVGRRILVVDDNDVDRRLVEKTLAKLKCTVLTAEDGEKGIQTAINEQPDLILSDCRMPNMDGVEMCRRLKTHEKTKHIPLIFLTSSDSPSDVINCFDVDADNFMCKPINPSILRSQIVSLLNEKFSD